MCPVLYRLLQLAEERAPTHSHKGSSIRQVFPLPRFQNTGYLIMNSQNHSASCHDTFFALPSPPDHLLAFSPLHPFPLQPNKLPSLTAETCHARARGFTRRAAWPIESGTNKKGRHEGYLKCVGNTKTNECSSCLRLRDRGLKKSISIPFYLTIDQIGKASPGN